MISVEAGLYIGSVSDLKNPEALTNTGITHILSVDSEQPELSGFHTKFVHALDDSSTDLLSKMDSCVQFISDALNASSSSSSSTSTSSVLVHWWGFIQERNCISVHLVYSFDKRFHLKLCRVECRPCTEMSTKLSSPLSQLYDYKLMIIANYFPGYVFCI